MVSGWSFSASATASIVRLAVFRAHSNIAGVAFDGTDFAMADRLL
jgi:hypothetical protein